MITLATFNHDFGQIRVQQNRRSGDVTFVQGGCYQSRCDILGVSLAPYIHALFHLILQAKAKNVLMIGCGGGSLATLLVKRGVGVTIVDINPLSIDIARKYFGLPAVIECHIADGADFLALCSRRYDAIVMDAYCGTDIPCHLCDAAFFRLAKTCLWDDPGVFLTNVHLIDDDDNTAKEYASVASQLWSAVRILDAPGEVYRNAIVLAGNVFPLRTPSIVKTPLTCITPITDELSKLRFV
ncbi:MAG: fused MFS/spermidine synthase [Marinicaulis sp.]|nr:fused MFS/spermidine synthase [Marinicaulis sp.]